jgi:hypothetical protein
MTKKPFPLSKVYCLIEPGPVVMVSTTGEGGSNLQCKRSWIPLRFITWRGLVYNRNNVECPALRDRLRVSVLTV